jgi:hypothetical protein
MKSLFDSALCASACDARGYPGLKGEFAHVNHSAGEYVNGAFHTNGIENFWSLFKRRIIGSTTK